MLSTYLCSMPLGGSGRPGDVETWGMLSQGAGGPSTPCPDLPPPPGLKILPRYAVVAGGKTMHRATDGCHSPAFGRRWVLGRRWCHDHPAGREAQRSLSCGAPALRRSPVLVCGPGKFRHAALEMSKQAEGLPCIEHH